MTVGENDRPKVLFVTWPHPLSTSGFTAPKDYSRKRFARAIEDAADFALGSGGTKVESIAVFLELHKSGNPHFHAIVTLDSKSRAAHKITAVLREKYRIAARADLVIGGSAKRPRDRCLQYLMTPTPSKPVVDASPYLTDPDIVSARLRDTAMKATARLEKGAATADEAYKYLQVHTGVKTYDQLLTHLDAADLGLLGQRVSRFVNTNIVRAPEIFTALLARRDRKANADAFKTTPKGYLVKSISEVDRCVCAEDSDSLEKDLDFLSEFHGTGNLAPFFKWAGLFLTDDLPTPFGRPRNVFVIGSPGSGKSSLADLVRFVMPSERVYEPVLSSSTPYSLLDPARHLLAACDDWRFGPKVPVTNTLKWLEGRSFGVDVKCAEPKQHVAGPAAMFSANHNEFEGSQWRSADVRAFFDRCYTARMRTPIPSEKRVKNLGRKMANCGWCRLRTLAIRCAPIQALWEERHGPLGCA